MDELTAPVCHAIRPTSLQNEGITQRATERERERESNSLPLY